MVRRALLQASAVHERTSSGPRVPNPARKEAVGANLPGKRTPGVQGPTIFRAHIILKKRFQACCSKLVRGNEDDSQRTSSENGTAERLPRATPGDRGKDPAPPAVLVFAEAGAVLISFFVVATY